MKISFCIITDGKRIAKLEALVASIQNQALDSEIVICGDLGEMIRFPGVIYVAELVGARDGILGLMRNRGVRATSGEIVVVCDDDMLFRSGFVEGILDAYPFDILCVRMENPDGSRYWDWATYGGSKGHVLLGYDEIDDDVYVTGGLCVARREVLVDVGWDESLVINHQEDGEFSDRIKNGGYEIRVCPGVVAVHDDDRLTSEGFNHIVLK